MEMFSYLGRSLVDYVGGRTLRNFYQEYDRISRESGETPVLRTHDIHSLTSKDRVLDQFLYVAVPAVVQLGILGAFSASQAGLYTIPSDNVGDGYALLFGAEALRMLGYCITRMNLASLSQWYARERKLRDEVYQSDLFKNRLSHLLDASMGIPHSSGTHVIRPPGMPRLQPAKDEAIPEESNWEEGEDWKKGNEYDPHSN